MIESGPGKLINILTLVPVVEDDIIPVVWVERDQISPLILAELLGVLPGKAFCRVKCEAAADVRIFDLHEIAATRSLCWKYIFFWRCEGYIIQNLDTELEKKIIFSSIRALEMQL